MSTPQTAVAESSATLWALMESDRGNHIIALHTNEDAAKHAVGSRHWLRVRPALCTVRDGRGYAEGTNPEGCAINHSEAPVEVTLWALQTRGWSCGGWGGEILSLHANKADAVAKRGDRMWLWVRPVPCYVEGGRAYLTRESREKWLGAFSGLPVQ